MAPQVRPMELRRAGSGHLEPELLGCSHVCALMDADPEDQLLPGYARAVQEMQEELDQRCVAVDEANAVITSVRLALRACSPVGDNASQGRLPIVELSDARSGLLTDRV